MLKSLFIQNYALIDTLDIRFEPGFSVITGETGAGKSILLGAVCMGVGMMTGADFSRIWATLDDKYHVEMYYQYFLEVWSLLQAELM